jgi:hypothetical protein
MTAEDKLLVPESRPGLVPLGFLCTLLEDGILETMVREALEARAQLPGGVRADLDRALNDQIKRVVGFRNASVAPAHVILRQVCELAQASPYLSEPVLRAWYETHPDLRSAVAALLEEREIPVRESDSLAEPLEVVSQHSPVSELLPACEERLPEYDRNKVKLMVQILSGKALVDEIEEPEPEPPDGKPEPGRIHFNDDLPVSNVLQTALETLALVPPTSPEWEAAIPEFSASLVNLIATKQEERETASMLGNLLTAMREEHGGLLEFFQCDTSNWQLEACEPGFPLQQVKEQASRFRELLDEYAPLHDRAPVAAEEMARSTRRMELFPRILNANDVLQRLFNGEDPATGGEEPESKEDSESVCSGESSAPGDSVPAVGVGEVPDLTELFATVSPCDIEERLLLQLAYQDLEQDNEDLEHENEGLKNQVKDLEQRLYETRSHQESLRWAVAYRDNPEEREEIPALESVGAAVALAKERYPGQLLFQLNAESEAEKSEFKWPSQVWDALRWLATDYFYSHLGDHPILNIDAACRQACGMWYKTSQHETTMTQFRESYTTRVNGRIIWLGEHIGKGNSFDQRRTIRIAFDWDRQLQKVVIGYIGQHQRTAAT